MFHCSALSLLLIGLATRALAASSNVLFIAVDDLRPQLGSYGKQFMHTPHIDRLARRGVLFERAYAMVPTYGASRASLMTGLRPSPNRFVNFLAWAERDAASVVTLNSQFKNNGYTTISLGKVFHHPGDKQVCKRRRHRALVLARMADEGIPFALRFSSDRIVEFGSVFWGQVTSLPRTMIRARSSRPAPPLPQQMEATQRPACLL